MLARGIDMFECLENRPDGLGFMGTDIWTELPTERQPEFPFLALEIQAARLALLTTEEKVEPLKRAIAEPEQPLFIATTYPQGARLAINGLAQSRPWGRRPVRVLNINGSVEGAPKIFPEVDAVYDIVESGQTAEENGVQIVYDNLAPVVFGALVKIEGGQT